MQSFYLLFKFGLVLIYVLKVYRKKSSLILSRKNMFNSLLAFSSCIFFFFSIFERFLYWKSRHYSSSFLQKFSSEIFLSWIINYWGSVLHTLYLTWGAFSLICVLSVFFFFLSSFSFLFLSVLPLTDTNDSQNNKNVEGIIIFLVFHFHLLTNIHLVHWDFYHFFLIDLFVITRLIADETCSP